ncbi:poly(rC)-binding protein 2-like [Bolinopsis microptera]|uniref:poly(rC)-binding protein 2-like n=1 Tax=Bolinopsis microptera TaxID=2820187 RepID=UPI00307AFB5B
MEENKRSLDENVVSDGAKKKARSATQVLIRLLVPNKVVGGLIGKGGENIQNLRSACPDATIKVKETPECPHAEERVVHVECEVNDIYAIFSQLIPQIFDGLTKQGYDNVKEPEVCVLFSGVTMGSIIGKGGKVISGLRTSSGAFIKAFPNKLQNSDERVLLLKGEVDKIIECLTQIYNTVEMDTGPYKQYNPVDGASIPREPGTGGYQDGGDSFDSGRRSNNNRGSHGSNRQMGSGFAPPPPFRKPAPDFYSAPFKSRGDPYGYSHHGAAQYDFPQTTAPPTAYPTPEAGGFGGGDDGHGVGTLLASFISKYPFTIFQGTDGDAHTVKEVTLENTLTGCVIGDKGSRIRDVRNSSGARIRIADFDSAGAGERLITIEGNNIQAHLAEYMLQCCVQSFSGHATESARAPPQRKKLQANPAAAPNSFSTWGAEQPEQTTPASTGW